MINLGYNGFLIHDHSFGGDPYLSGEASYETIIGIQSQGVQACAKHYVNKCVIFRFHIAPEMYLAFPPASKSTHEKLAPQMLTTGASCNQRYITAVFKYYCRAVSFTGPFLLCAFY